MSENSNQQDNTINNFGEFLEQLKDADPEISEMLDDFLDNYDLLVNREVRKRESQKKAIKKYFQSEKGKLKNREANKRYYYKNKTTNNKVGRPKKEIQEILE